MLHLRFSLAALILAMPALTAAQSAEPVKTLELFTSQGCNSCPPADRLAAEFAHDPHLLVISFPVDYWDYLGWKDSFASAAFTARQKAYARARGDMKVYTPQVVVNGGAIAVGSNRSAIETELRQAHSSAIVRIEAEGGEFVIQVAASGGGVSVHAPAQIWAVPLIHSAEVAIGRGENAGTHLVYTNVARGLVRIGEWDSGPRSFKVPVASLRGAGANAVAILVQTGSSERPGPLLGGGYAALP